VAGRKTQAVAHDAVAADLQHAFGDLGIIVDREQAARVPKARMKSSRVPSHGVSARNSAMSSSVSRQGARSSRVVLIAVIQSANSFSIHPAVSMDAARPTVAAVEETAMRRLAA
jgi:hypothetical protein